MDLNSDRFEPESMPAALAAFRQDYPAFDTTQLLDDLRARDFARLDEAHHTYLDYTGGGLYGASQLREHMELLTHNVFGNPHSSNPTSLAMTRLVEKARAYVLEFFNASPDEYVAIFTMNASGALKLVGEAYPFGPGDHYLLTSDNHNSVNGIREFARARGARFTYLPVVPPDLRIEPGQLSTLVDLARPGAHNLFAFPAQSNFSGVQHPLEMIDLAHARGWDVLLDAAAFVASNRLDLSRWHPDYVPLSFYKMFGYPTGIGCLLARKSALTKLNRPWYAGGTITVSSVQGDKHYLAEGEAGFEDGTVNYLNIPAVEIGLRHLNAIGIEAIHTRVMCLTGWLIDNLSALRHSNGSPIARIHGPRDLNARGGTITMTLYDARGDAFDDQRVEELANRANISLRTGCFCNPGAGEITHGLSKEEIGALFSTGRGMTFHELRTAICSRYGKSISAVRVSVGLVSNFGDLYRFLRFAESFRDMTLEDIGPFQQGEAYEWMNREST